MNRMVKVSPNYLSRSQSRYNELRRKISGTRGGTKKVKPPTNSRSQTRSLANTGRQRASPNLSRLSRVVESRSRRTRTRHNLFEPIPIPKSISRSRNNRKNNGHNGAPSF